MPPAYTSSNDCNSASCALLLCLLLFRNRLLLLGRNLLLGRRWFLCRCYFVGAHNICQHSNRHGPEGFNRFAGKHKCMHIIINPEESGGRGEGVRKETSRMTERDRNDLYIPKKKRKTPVLPRASSPLSAGRHLCGAFPSTFCLWAVYKVQYRHCTLP